MQLLQKTVEMKCTLILNERETEMLGYLAGFGADNIAEAICAHLTSQFPKKEWQVFWSELRSHLESSSRKFSDTRKVFTGEKRAVALDSTVS